MQNHQSNNFAYEMPKDESDEDGIEQDYADSIEEDQEEQEEDMVDEMEEHDDEA